MNSNLESKGFGCFALAFVIALVIAVAFYVMFFIFLGKGCDHVIDEGEGSFIKGIGSITKDIENKFNEGYQKDTVVLNKKDFENEQIYK